MWFYQEKHWRFFWESSCPQFLKPDFFYVFKDWTKKNAKAHLTLSVDLKSFCLQVYHLSVSRQCRKKWDVILGNAIWNYLFYCYFFHLYGITCSKVPANNIYFHYSNHFQNLVILWNISISTFHLLSNTLSLSSWHNSVKFFFFPCYFYVLVETRSHFVSQTGLKFLGSLLQPQKYSGYSKVKMIYSSTNKSFTSVTLFT